MIDEVTLFNYSWIKKPQLQQKRFIFIIKQIRIILVKQLLKLFFNCIKLGEKFGAYPVPNHE